MIMETSLRASYRNYSLFSPQVKIYLAGTLGLPSLKSLEPFKVSQRLTSQEAREIRRQQDLKPDDELEPHSSR